MGNDAGLIVNSLADALGLVVGSLVGLVLGAILCVVVSLVVHPSITFLFRALYGDARRARIAIGNDDPAGPRPSRDGEYKALVLSDMHIDTWEDGKLSERTRFLQNLLTWAETHCDRLIVNGDLLDTPPHPNNQLDPTFVVIPHDWPVEPVANADNLINPHKPLAPGAIQPRFYEALSLLIAHSKPTVGGIGNHDIGINGLRMVLPKSKLLTWAPGVLFRSQESRGQVFVEHGHLHDAVLWIYVAYSLIDLLARGDSSTSGQRGGRVGKAGGATHRTKDINSKSGAFESVIEQKDKLGWPERITRFSYRMAAYRRLRDLRARRYGEEIGAVLMGHTHIPDRYQLTGDCVYVNIGDWAGNKDHLTFALIEHDGGIVGPWPYDQLGLG